MTCFFNILLKLIINLFLGLYTERNTTTLLVAESGHSSISFSHKKEDPIGYGYCCCSVKRRKICSTNKNDVSGEKRGTHATIDAAIYRLGFLITVSRNRRPIECDILAENL